MAKTKTGTHKPPRPRKTHQHLRTYAIRVNPQAISNGVVGGPATITGVGGSTRYTDHVLSSSTCCTCSTPKQVPD